MRKNIKNTSLQPKKQIRTFFLITFIGISIILAGSILLTLTQSISPESASSTPSVTLQAQNGIDPPIQTWNKSWDSGYTDWTQKLAVDENGIYIVGHVYPGGPPLSASIVKFNTSGEFAWADIYNDTNEERANDVVTDSAHNVYMVGYSDASSDFDVLVVKYNSAGAQIWNFTWDSGFNDDDTIYSAAIDSSDNLYLAGKTDRSAGNLDPLLLKFDPSTKTVLWNDTWIGVSGNDYANDIVLDGNYLYIVGQTLSFGVGEDAFLAKYDLDGNLIWNRTWGGNAVDRAFSVDVDGSHNVYVAGDTASFGAGNKDAFIAKYSNTGTLRWNTTLGDTLMNRGLGVAVGECNYIILVGMTDQSGFKISVYDGFAAIFDPNGNYLWNMTWGTISGSEDAQDVVVEDGTVYISGKLFNATGNGNDDAILFKYAIEFPTCGGIPGFSALWMFVSISFLVGYLLVFLKVKKSSIL